MILTDFHSHILPSIDDGSASVEESVAMLRMELEQGICHVVATPHFYPQHDTPENFINKRERAYEQLCAAVSKESGFPQVSLGAEVYFFRGMNQSEALKRLTIADKKCILIEMPPAPWADEVYRELEEIYLQRGITPIIAHIDRYIRPLRTCGIPQRLAQLPVLVQANASFFLERGTAGMAMRMLKADQIHLLGSDCHNTRTRKPNLGNALHQIQNRLGEDAIRKLQGYESIILNA